MADAGAVLPPQPSSPTPPPIPATPPKPHTFFRGPNGIRAGWRVLIFSAIFVAILVVVAIPFALAVYLAGHGDQPGIHLNTSMTSPLGLSLTEGASFVLVSVAALLMALIERRKWGQYGLPIKFAFRKDFWVGTLAGFLAISTCLLGIFAMHGFRLTGLATRGSAILPATAAWAVTFILVGLSEEFTFRGYLQFTLTTGMGFWPSAILLSLLFGAAHAGNPGETGFGLFSVVLFGLVFCLILRRTGNLWWAVGFHAGWDWGQTFFYGVADSGIAPSRNLFNCTFSGPNWLTGGSVGPEASIFTPIVLVIVAILFIRVYRENRYQPLGMQP